MYLRLLLIALAVWAAVMAVRALRGRARREPPRRRLPEGERMVRCARCGTFVPESRAVRTGGASYCSAEHAETRDG